MKIDFHVHILSSDIVSDIGRYKLRHDYFETLHADPRSKFATAEDVVRELDKCGFDRAVVFGFGSKDTGICREANDYVIEAVERFSDRLIGFMLVNPLDPGVEREVARCHESGLVGIGELLPDGQSFNLRDQKSLSRFTGVAKERSLPVLMHCNEQVGHYYPGKGEVGPSDAYEFALNNPDLTIIYAHWGGGLVFYELMPEVNEVLKNVYYDTAADVLLYSESVYEMAHATGVIRKIVFGSDFPLLSPERYLSRINRTSLSPNEMNKILGKNAASLLSQKGCSK